MKANGNMGIKTYSKEMGHMIKMAAMPIYDKNLQNFWPCNYVCSIRYPSSTKIVQIITLAYFSARSNMGKCQYIGL